MTIIKARPNRVRSVGHICHLQEPNRDALVRYARFIENSVDHMVHQLIVTTRLKTVTSWQGTRRIPTKS